MEEFDDFFDSPRGKASTSGVQKGENNATRKQFSESNQPLGDIDLPSTTAKPPAHPNSRPTSGVNRHVVAIGDQVDNRTSKRVIEAKLPVTDDNDYDYSSEDFDIDGSESDSGRITPTSRHSAASTRHPGGQTRTANTIDKRSSTKIIHDMSILSDEDSDNCSEVTDVSPMNSPVNTPHSKYEKKLPSNDISSKSTLTDKTYIKNKQHGSSKFNSGICRADSDAVDLDVLLQTVLHMESSSVSSTDSRQRLHSVRPQSAQRGGTKRRNYSFSNDQLRAIDRENERLMKKIMKHAAEAKKAKNQTIKPKGSSNVQKRPSSSAINRAKQLQKIESDNLMLLSRLQQTRPSRELRRDTLVDEFEHRSVGSNCLLSRPTSAVSVPRPNSALTRPVAARQRTVSSNQSEQKHRPRSSSTNGRYQSADDSHSRPGTVFASRPDDDDVLTWEDGF